MASSAASDAWQPVASPPRRVSVSVEFLIEIIYYFHENLRWPGQLQVK